MKGKDSVSLKDYAADVFDLDGTLFTIPVDWVKVREEVGKMAGAPMRIQPCSSKWSNSSPSIRLLDILSSRCLTYKS